MAPFRYCFSHCQEGPEPRLPRADSPLPRQSITPNVWGIRSVSSLGSEGSSVPGPARTPATVPSNPLYSSPVSSICKYMQMYTNMLMSSRWDIQGGSSADPQSSPSVQLPPWDSRVVRSDRVVNGGLHKPWWPRKAIRPGGVRGAVSAGQVHPSVSAQRRQPDHTWLRVYPVVK